MKLKRQETYPSSLNLYSCSLLRGKDIIQSSKAAIELVCRQIVTGRVRRKWLVLVGAFVCQVFSAGFGNSVGVFFVEFLETFHTGRAVVGWATSICSGLVFGAGKISVPSSSMALAGIKFSFSYSFYVLLTSTFLTLTWPV